MALVSASAALLLAASTEGFDRNAVTPGPAGFIATAAVGLAVIVLGIDLVRRLRRVQYREEAEALLDAEAAQAEAAAQASGQEARAADGNEDAAATAADDAK